MRKVLVSLMAVGLLSSSAMAFMGKVTQIVAKSNGVILVQVTPTDSNLPVKKNGLVGTADAKKAMLAIALTAKSTDSIIITDGGSYNGKSGWKTVKIK